MLQHVNMQNNTRISIIFLSLKLQFKLIELQ